ncbi:DUF5304 family protein [Kitasatospora sp. NPDC057015]|uniref:DUF5304 family protein n=1 Tax=Kitasatospora sp. NPDC057015 TaxID=3346001 RepID=UPI00363D807C
MTTADDRTDRPAEESAAGAGTGRGAAPEGEGRGRDAGSGEGAAGKEHPFGSEFGPLVDEVRRFAKAVGEKAEEAGVPQFAAAALGSLGSLASGGALGALSDLPGALREKHPEVYGHLSTAGGELLAAYRAAVAGHERRWSAGDSARSERIDLDTPDGPSVKE